MVNLGLITAHSFGFNLMLAPAVVLGAFVGRWLVVRINQPLFEKLVLALSAIAGILLICCSRLARCRAALSIGPRPCALVA